MKKVSFSMGVYILSSYKKVASTQFTMQRFPWELLPVGSVKERIEQIHDISNALGTLLSASRSAISSLESRTKKHADFDLLPYSSPKPTAHTLPDEVLCHVLNFVYDVVPFSQVCQKFRRIALALPTLWTKITSDMTLPMVKAYLSRSGTAPLNIVFQPTDHKPFMLQPAHSFILAVFKHAHRIKRLSMTMPYYVERFSAWMIRDGRTNNIALPMVEHLDLNWSSERGNFQDDCYQFVANWKLPSLRSLYTYNMLPYALSERGKITSLDLEFEGGSEPFISSTHKLLDILRSNPQLQSLSLTISNHKFNPYSGPPVVMENVETLKLGWLSSAPDACSPQDDVQSVNEIEAMGELIRHVKFPTVITMTLDIQVTFWKHAQMLLQQLLSGQATFENVASLELKLLCSLQHDFDRCYVDSILHKFPNLRNLTLDAVVPNSPDFWPAKDLRPLVPKLDSVQMRLRGTFSNAAITRPLDFTDARKFVITHRSRIDRSMILNKYHHKADIVWKEEVSDESY